MENSFIKRFVNTFLDFALTFFDSSFNSFLFEVTFLLKFFNSSFNSFLFELTFLFNFSSLSSKSVYEISNTIFAC